MPAQHAPIAIVGAGPIGIELAAALHRAGCHPLHFEAGQIGHTLTWWPRNTHFFSTTERLELAGIPIQTQAQDRLTGEEYLAYLRSIVEQLNLPIRTYEKVVGIQPQAGGFLLTTRTQAGQNTYTCDQLVLANGDMDFPRLLGIPGENLPHVSHYFNDPHLYFRKRLLIVGGRNSAVEAALRCWRAGAQVSLSYRRATFDQRAVKHWLLPDVQTQIELGIIGFYPETVPLAITHTHVVLEHIPDGRRLDVPADFVLLSTGFVADTTLFELAGVNLIGEACAPEYDPETMQTNVPGLYVAGVVAAGTQTNYRLFIENCHEHVGKIVRSLTGRWPDQLGAIPARRYDLPLEDIQTN